MRWCPKPMRIVPTTMAPEEGGANGPSSFAGAGAACAFEVTRSPLTKGESSSASGMATSRIAASPTFIRCRKATLALSLVEGSLPVASKKYSARTPDGSVRVAKGHVASGAWAHCPGQSCCPS